MGLWRVIAFLTKDFSLPDPDESGFLKERCIFCFCPGSFVFAVTIESQILFDLKKKKSQRLQRHLPKEMFYDKIFTAE